MIEAFFGVLYDCFEKRVTLGERADILFVTDLSWEGLLRAESFLLSYCWFSVSGAEGSNSIEKSNLSSYVEFSC